MEPLSIGLFAIANGLIEFFRALGSPTLILALLLAASFAWIGVLKIEEMDRSFHKPDIENH